jgi:DDE_Tnp_1-associated
METSPDEFEQPSRRRLLLHHFSRIEDTRKPEGVAHKLNEVLLLCVCATRADCDSFDAIAAWGEAILGSCASFCPTIGAFRRAVG